MEKPINIPTFKEHCQYRACGDTDNLDKSIRLMNADRERRVHLEVHLIQVPDKNNNELSAQNVTSVAKFDLRATFFWLYHFIDMRQNTDMRDICSHKIGDVSFDKIQSQEVTVLRGRRLVILGVNRNVSRLTTFDRMLIPSVNRANVNRLLLRQQ